VEDPADPYGASSSGIISVIPCKGSSRAASTVPGSKRQWGFGGMHARPRSFVVYLLRASADADDSAGKRAPVPGSKPEQGWAACGAAKPDGGLENGGSWKRSSGAYRPEAGPPPVTRGPSHGVSAPTPGIRG
jgi:hypothetical protein